MGKLTSYPTLSFQLPLEEGTLEGKRTSLKKVQKAIRTKRGQGDRAGLQPGPSLLSVFLVSPIVLLVRIENGWKGKILVKKKRLGELFS